MPDIDLRAMRIFAEVYKTGSVSRAAEHLGLTQSAVSIGLGNLRRYYTDALFVRTSSGMRATPHAERLAKPINDALTLLTSTLEEQPLFDPFTSDRVFEICMTDISHLVLLPALLNRLARIAPNIRVSVSIISAATPVMLETGSADLAIGFMPELEAGFYQQRLFDQSFACVVRKSHPRIRDRLSLRQFKDEGHILVSGAGTGHSIVERALAKQRIKRRIALRLPNLLGVGLLVGSTDLVVTVPRRVAAVLTNIAPNKVLTPPMELPSYLIKQHWHERYHQDPANVWLRKLVANLSKE